MNTNDKTNNPMTDETRKAYGKALETSKITVLAYGELTNTPSYGGVQEFQKAFANLDQVAHDGEIPAEDIVCMAMAAYSQLTFGIGMAHAHQMGQVIIATPTMWLDMVNETIKTIEELMTTAQWTERNKHAKTAAQALIAQAKASVTEILKQEKVTTTALSALVNILVNSMAVFHNAMIRIHEHECSRTTETTIEAIVEEPETVGASA